MQPSNWQWGCWCYSLSFFSCKTFMHFCYSSMVFWGHSSAGAGEVLACCMAVWPHLAQDEMRWKCGADARDWAAYSIPACETHGSWTLSLATSLGAPATSQVAAAVRTRHAVAKELELSGALAVRQPRSCIAASEHLCPLGPNRKTAKPKRSGAGM